MEYSPLIAPVVALVAWTLLVTAACFGTEFYYRWLMRRIDDGSPEGIQIRAIFKPGREERLIGAKEDALWPQNINDPTDATGLNPATAKFKVDIGQIDNLAGAIYIVTVRFDDRQVRVAQRRLP